MDFKTMYDGIIDWMEKNVLTTPAQVYEELAQDLGLNIRTLGDGFQFVSGMTIAQYIKMRRVVQAMGFKLRTGYSLEKVAEKYEFPDQSALSRACKNVFGVPPTSVTEVMIAKKLPLTLDTILSGETEYEQPEEQTAETGQSVETVAIAEGTNYALLRRIFEINTLYGFDDAQLAQVLRFVEEYNVELEEIFDFADTMYTRIRDKGKLRVGDCEYTAKEIAHLCLKFGCTYREAEVVIYGMRDEGYGDVTQMPDEYLDLYFELQDKKQYDMSPGTVELLAEKMEARNIPFEVFGEVADAYMQDCAKSMDDAIDMMLYFTDCEPLQEIGKKMIAELRETMDSLPDEGYESVMYDGLQKEPLPEPVFSTRIADEYDEDYDDEYDEAESLDANDDKYESHYAVEYYEEGVYREKGSIEEQNDWGYR